MYYNMHCSRTANSVREILSENHYEKSRRTGYGDFRSQRSTVLFFKLFLILSENNVNGQ